MTTFDFHRFTQALRCHLMVSRKSIVTLFGIGTLVMLMADLFFTRISFHDYDERVAQWGLQEVIETYQRDVEASSVFAAFFFCIAMLIGASMLFRQMKTTPQRSAFLTWPVSNLEKYVIAVLHHVVLMLLMAFAAIILADALRVLLDWSTGRVVIWSFTMPFKNISWAEWQQYWMFLTWMFYFHSLFIVGGTLFRRQQFLLTSMTIVVVSILLMMLLNQFSWDGFEMTTGTWDEKTLTYTRIYYPAFYIVCIVGNLLIAFHYWASYKLFCRMQVINNKWLNV